MVLISPMTWSRPVVTVVSQATRAWGSCSKIASSTASEIWSQILSGCPSVTDSEVKSLCAIFFLPFFSLGTPSLSARKKRGPLIRRSAHTTIAALSLLAEPPYAPRRLV